MADAYDYLLKLLLIGEAKTGKSSIMSKLSQDKFDEEYKSTIGVEFSIKFLEINGKRVKLQLWDTAGEERFRAITAAYYRGAQGIMLVYDITNEQSFSGLPKWIDEIKQYASEDVEVLLLANKCDLEGERSVSEQQGQKFAIQNDLDLMYVSAKTGMNIEEAFMTLAQKLVGKLVLRHPDVPTVH